MENIKKADEVWVVLGFIFSLLGGLIGIVIGINYIKGNYDKETKKKGWIITILGLIIFGIIKALF